MRKVLALVATLATPLVALTGLAATTQPASAAVVYCTYIGYPTHCVVRPGVRLVVRPRVVYCTYIGYPVHCVVRPGVRLVARPRHVGVSPTNRNGGVNRAGVRR